MGDAREFATAVLVEPAPISALGPVVEAAERLGYGYCYVADQGLSNDVYVLLGALAVGSSRILLGPGVTNPYTRYPAVTATAIATLDEASEGRAFLGLGAGGTRALDELGLDRLAPVDACTELVSIAKRLCPRPIEIHWAARGPKMIAAGARLADVMVLNGIAHRELPAVVASIDQATQHTGRRPRIQYGAALVFDEASREGLRARTAFRLVDTPRRVRHELDVSDSLHAKLREAVRTEGPVAAAALVEDRLLAEYVIDAGDDPVEQLRALVREHDIGGVTIDISDISTAEARLEAAADVFARI